MNNCHNAQKYLSDYLEGEIPSKLKKDVNSHLNNCSKCSEIFTTAGKIRFLLQNLPGIKASDKFEEKLRQRIIEQNFEDRRPINEFLTSRVALASAFVLILAFLLFSGIRYGLLDNSENSPSITSEVTTTSSSNKSKAPHKLNQAIPAIPVNKLEYNPAMSQIDTSSEKAKPEYDTLKDKIKYINSK